MKVVPALILVLPAVAVGFGLGRLTAPSTELSGVGSGGGGSESAVEAIDADGVLDWVGGSAFRPWGDGLEERLRSSDVATIAAELAARQPPNVAALSRVMGIYAESDPEAAWELANQLSGQSRNVALSAVISGIARVDPHRALSLLDALDSDMLRSQLSSMVLGYLASTDPNSALEIALSGDSVRNQVAMVFHAWVRTHPEAARKAALQLDGEAAEAARMALVSYLSERDPEAAFEFVRELPGEVNRSLTVSAISQWVMQDPQAALDAALAVEDPGLRSEALRAAISGYARSDYPAALDYVLGLPDADLRTDLLTCLPADDKKHRGELLNAVFELMPPGEMYRRTVSSILGSWARDDPKAAAEIATQLPPGQMLADVAGRIASAWAHHPEDRTAALEWAINLPPGTTQQRALHNLLSAWSEQDPASALTAASALPDAARTSAINSVLGSWARSDPFAVLEYSESSPNEEVRATARSHAIRSWAALGSGDAARAADYVSQLPEAEQTPLLRTVIQQWARRDAMEAANWLADQPPSGSRDRAITGLTRSLALDDPQYAIEWAGAISDEPARVREIESLARDWMRHDASSARQWIESSTLPDPVKSKLLN